MPTSAAGWGATSASNCSCEMWCVKFVRRQPGMKDCRFNGAACKPLLAPELCAGIVSCLAYCPSSQAVSILKCNSEVGPDEPMIMIVWPCSTKVDVCDYHEQSTECATSQKLTVCQTIGHKASRDSGNTMYCLTHLGAVTARCALLSGSQHAEHLGTRLQLSRGDAPCTFSAARAW